MNKLVNPNCNNWYKEITRLKKVLREYKAEYAVAVEKVDFEKCKKLKHQLKTSIEKMNREISLKKSFISRIGSLGIRPDLELLVEEASYIEAKSLAKALAPDADLPTYREIIRRIHRLKDQELYAIGRITKPGLVIVPAVSLHDMLTLAQSISFMTFGEGEFSSDYKASEPSKNPSVCIIDMDPNPDEIGDQIPIFQNNDIQYDNCRKYLKECLLRLPKDTEYLLAGIISVQRYISAVKNDSTTIKPGTIILDHFSSSKPTCSFIDNGFDDGSICSADISSAPFRFRFRVNSKSDNSAYLRARSVFELK